MAKYGLKFPLSFSFSEGYKQLDTIKEYFRFCIKLLFLTSKGEKINDFYYGINLREFLFRNKNTVLQTTIGGEIKAQIERSIPSVKIEDIQISEEEEEGYNNLYVKVIYTIPSFNISDFVVIKNSGD
ncbi:MAG: GPW/gp25 family protein [Patescibacteria group bacterium]|nr:GPW/gp25 family protein [Patescibacteria group bacterium]